MLDNKCKNKALFIESSKHAHNFDVHMQICSAIRFSHHYIGNDMPLSFSSSSTMEMYLLVYRPWRDTNTDS